MRPVASFVASRNSASPGADGVLDLALHRSDGKREVGVAREAGGHHERAVDERLGDAFLHLGERVVAHAGQDVAAEHELRLAGGDPRRMELLGRIGDAHVRDDGAVLLREARHVEHAAALAFEVRGHADQRADRHHPGAADAGDEDAVGLGRRRRAPARASAGNSPASAFFGFRRLPPSTVTKLGQKPFTQRVVLVARALVDRALPAELGLDRRDRHAVRLDAAIAAAFADELVDDHALRRVGKLAALAAPALLRRAGLVVEQHRAARRVAQLALDGVELVAVVDLDAAVEIAGRILVGLVADDDDLRDAFGRHLPRDVAAARSVRRPAGRRSSRRRRCRGSCR